VADKLAIAVDQLRDGLLGGERLGLFGNARDRIAFHRFALLSRGREGDLPRRG